MKKAPKMMLLGAKRRPGGPRNQIETQKNP
jgi:hypothetical protein